MPKESERREFYARLGLDPNLARLKGKEFTDALADIRSHIKPYGPDDIVKGRATAEAFDRIRESISSLRDTIGADLAPAMTQATDAVRTFIEANGGELRKVFVDVADAIKTAPWKEWGTDIRDAAKYIDSAAQSLGGWKTVMEGLIALKLVNVIAPVASLGLAAVRTAASLAAMGATLAALTAPAWLLALLAGVSAKALIETVRPQPLNKDEDELARQKKYGLAPKDGDKGVHAAARAIRKKIEAPADESTAPARKGSAMPISYGGDTGAASFRREDTAERAILKGTYEGTRQGVLAAFKEWVESRRQGAGGFINANYQPGASGGMGGGAGAPAGSPGAPETPRAGQGRTPLPNIVQPPAATTPHAQTPNQGATPRVQAPATTTPAAPTAPRGTTPQARRSEPSEAAAARAMKDFAAGGSKSGSLTELINEESRRAGIDPRIMEGIRAGESDRKSHYDIGDLNNGPAYGPFQLNVGRDRAGDKFQRETGLDLRNPSTIAAQTRWVAHNIAKQLKKDPNYFQGGSQSRLHAVWHGFSGLRNADPHWGESGYRPSKEQAAKREAPKSEGHPAVKGMNEWIEKQRGAHPDAAHSPQSDRGGLLNVNLMRSAREAELVHAPQKVVGDASLKISMHGFPKGTKTESKINGMFKTLTMYRGLAAPMADQEG
jgi:hypothetical protein